MRQHHRSEAAAERRPSGSRSAARSFGLLNGLLVAACLGVAGTLVYKALDVHSHTCDACGTRWSHTGARQHGVAEAHACPSCGQVQWWRDGVPHEVRAAHEAAERQPAPQGMMAA